MRSYNDCVNLGKTGASGVAYAVCGAYANRRPSFFPPNCIAIAKNTCKSHVTQEIDRLSGIGQCLPTKNANAKLIIW